MKTTIDIFSMDSSKYMYIIISLHVFHTQNIVFLVFIYITNVKVIGKEGKNLSI